MKTFEIKHRLTGDVLYSGGGETLRDVVEQAVKAHANLADANLAGAYLAHAYLADANLAGAYLAHANLAGANLAGANLAHANLAGANLEDANLAGAYLAHANLAHANLADANLAGAYLADANLAGAQGPLGLRLVGKRPVFQIGPIGSRCALLSAWMTESGVYVTAGCFTGTLDEFRAAVEKTHGENDHGNEYGMAMLMIEAHAAIWMPESEQFMRKRREARTA